jgi:hypothetical protein
MLEPQRRVVDRDVELLLDRRRHRQRLHGVDAQPLA